jgi:hypothetical protein
VAEVAVIADSHANLPALEAALAHTDTIVRQRLFHRFDTERRPNELDPSRSVGGGTDPTREGEQQMGKFIALGAAVAALVIATAAATAGNPNTLTLAVYGDAPYGTSNADTAEFAATPAFITSINGDASVQEVVHVGDIHSGSQRCTVAYDQSVYNLWTAYREPLVYTPGDNEWSDCTKPKELPGSDFAADPQMPLTQLGVVRSIFFAHPGQTLGQNPMQVTSQANAFDPAHPTDAQFVENVIWE